MTWESAIAAWVAWLQAGGRARSSVRLRRYQLLQLGAGVGGRPGTLTARRLTRWLAGREWSRETRRSSLAALRSFFGWASREGICAADLTADLARLRPVPGVPRPAGEADVTAALSRADPRTRLMVDLAARHGLRRGEIAVVAADDLMRSMQGWALVVHGKGGRDRVVPLLDPTAVEIRRQLEDGRRWLFPGRAGHLTAGHVGVLIGRMLPPGTTPHMLRHRFATVVYRSTRDILTLQRLLGHVSVATTQRYAAPDPDALRAVVAAAA